MFRGHRLVVLVGVVGLIALSACSTADPEISTESTETLASTPDSSTPDTSEPDSPGEIAVGLDLPTTLGVATVGGRVVEAGSRPVLSWDAVPGAVDYQLIVRDADGSTIWAWSGATTSIAIGGGADPAPSDTPAALITGASTWVVIAFDASGEIVAASADLEVAP